MPNSPLSGTGVVCSSHRFCIQAEPCTVNVSDRTVRKGTSRTGRAEGWTCWFRVAFTAAPNIQHPYSARAGSPNAARQQQSLAARGAERWERAEEAGEESMGRRAGLSLDSRRLHWNIVEGEPSKSYHPTKKKLAFMLMFVFGNIHISVSVLYTTGASCHKEKSLRTLSITKNVVFF